MSKRSLFRFGIVRVETGKTPGKSREYYLLKYWDRAAGRYVRRRLSGVGLSDVKARCEEITRRVLDRRLGAEERPRVPTLVEGLEQAIALSPGNRETRRSLAYMEACFARFVQDRFPKVRSWADMRPSILEEYQKTLEDAGLSAGTIKHRLVPAKMAWRRVQADFPGMVGEVPKIRPTRRTEPHRIECLEIADAVRLARWFRESAPDVYPITILQLVCGLRVYEAAAIRESDVDFAGGTLSVGKTAYHEPKNLSSYRTIPVPAQALEALRSAISSRKVIVPTGELFMQKRGGKPMIANTRRLCERMTEAFGAAIESMKEPRFAQVTPRSLRRSFVTALAQDGISETVLARYVGHTGGTMLATRYRRVDDSELRLVSTRMEEILETLGLQKH